MTTETPSFIISEAGGDTEFYAAYGLSLSLWSWVEHALCRVYLCVAHAPNTESLGRAFFAVTSFRDKVGMVDVLVSDALAKSDPRGRLAPEWKAIKNKLRRAASNRNSIAHVSVWSGPGIGSYGYGSAWNLAELPIKPVERERHVITLCKMRDIGRGFEITARRIEAFAGELRRLGVSAT
jgi:hypothetical protein